MLKEEVFANGVFPDRVPRLATPRLVLRPMELSDAPQIQLLAADREIAATTMTIPHPYPEGGAETFIRMQREEFANQKAIAFAIARREDDLLIGTIGIMLKPEDARGEIGYWVGVPYWGQGLVTEAAARVLQFGFEELGLNRIYAQHFHTNPASGAVMRKLVMKHEGVLRQHGRKWGEFVDYHCYAILRDEYFAENR